MVFGFIALFQCNDEAVKMSVIPHYENYSVRLVSATDLAVFKRRRLLGEALLSASAEQKHGETESE
jgi:hypothetical protein